MFDIFLGTWSQRNDILNDAIAGIKIENMDKQLRHIYKYHTFYLHRSDYELVTDVYNLDQALELPPYSKNHWLETLQISVKSRHTNLDCLQTVPNTLITDYFK